MKVQNIFFLLILSFNLYAQKPSDYISIQKTPCFGRCPVYTFTLKGNGEAILKVDTNFTMPKGVYTYQLEKEKVKEIFDAFKLGKIYTFKNEYTGKMTDFPVTYLTYKKGRKTKKIKDHYGAPKELKNLEGILVNTINEVTDWKKEQ